MRLPNSLCTVAFVLLSTGCAELDAFLPKVSFDRLDVREVSFEHVEADFVFLVDNPNPIQIDLASFSYALALEGVELLSGDAPEGFVLEQSGGSELVLPVGLVFAEIFETIDATRGEDVVDFDIAGHFGFDTPAGVARLPYDEAGDFPAIRTPTFTFQNLRVARIGFDSADLELDLGVDNAHGSALLFENFDYDLELEGTEIVSGLISTFEVEGATTGTVTLPIQIDLISAGVTLIDAILSGGKIDLGLDASMDVDTPFGVIPLSIDETGKLTVD